MTLYLIALVFIGRGALIQIRSRYTIVRCVFQYIFILERSRLENIVYIYIYV